MSRLRAGELTALWSLAMTTIGCSVYVATLTTKPDLASEHSQTLGIVIGGLMAALPMLINAIRNIGQSQVMQAMTEQLGQSSPTATGHTPKTAVAAANQTAAAAQDEANAIADMATDPSTGDMK